MRYGIAHTHCRLPGPFEGPLTTGILWFNPIKVPALHFFQSTISYTNVSYLLFFDSIPRLLDGWFKPCFCAMSLTCSLPISEVGKSNIPTAEP